MSQLRHKSIEELFRKYYPRLCHFAWQFLHDREAVEDIVQDAFMAFWNQHDNLADYDIAIKNFLYMTVRNGCLNYLRRDRNTQRFQQQYHPDEAEDPETLARIIRSEVLDEIYRIVNLMPDGCREVFRLGYLEGLSNPQIAEELDISINTVKTQKQRAMRIIKGRLNPELFIWAASFFVFL